MKSVEKMIFFQSILYREQILVYDQLGMMSRPGLSRNSQPPTGRIPTALQTEFPRKLQPVLTLIRVYISLKIFKFSAEKFNRKSAITPEKFVKHKTLDSEKFHGI